MPKSMEDLGLYSEQPDATVDSILYDETDPSFVEVKFSDGRVATMPASHAEAMPKTAVDPMTMGVPGATPMGPPAAPPPPAADPGFSAGPGLGAGAMGGLSPEDVMAQEQAAQAAPPAQLVGVDVRTGSGAAQTDPNAEIVSPGSPGGYAPFSTQDNASTTRTDTVDDPATMGARLDQGIEEAAGAERLMDSMRYSSARDSLDTELDARDAQAAEAQKLMRKAELERAEHQKIYEAVEATPIDEDGFWQESDGRKAGAWIALALSGFLSGVTRGQNPALGQMMQALDGAQDRWLSNQQKSRDSQLRQREKLMGSAENARDTYRLQLSGIVEKRIQLEAQREGLQPPPSLTTYIAKQGVKRAEAKNAIGSRVDQSTTQAVQNESRATAATGPVRRGDQVLQNLLGKDYDKKHADAMDPKGLNLGGVAAGAERLQHIEKALGAIAEKNGGSLPLQETISWNSLGLREWAARNGFGDGMEEIQVKQLLEEAKLAYKQTVNIKSIDSENEGKNFNAIMDSGEGMSTLDAIRTRAKIANEQAVSIASGVTRDTQGYLDFVLGTQKAVPGVTRGNAITPTRVLRAAKPGEERAVEETKGPEPAQPAGGGATPPLADTPPGQRQAWRPAIRAHAEEAGYNPDALERIIAFESGGRPAIRNPSGATGLIQFMPEVFKSMKKPPGYENVTHDDLKDLTVEEQMPLVISYFQERGLKPNADVGEYYLAVAAPGLLNKPDETVAYKKGSKAWEQNPSWRPADGGDITAGSIRAKGRKL
jgi:hypothetical protein